MCTAFLPQSPHSLHVTSTAIMSSPIPTPNMSVEEAVGTPTTPHDDDSSWDRTSSLLLSQVIHVCCCLLSLLSAARVRPADT